MLLHLELKNGLIVLGFLELLDKIYSNKCGQQHEASECLHRRMI